MKICICISGQFRHFSNCVLVINSFLNQIKRKYPSIILDVYIDTWESQGVTSDISRLIPDEFAKFMPISLNRNDRLSKIENNITTVLPFLNDLIAESTEAQKISTAMLEQINNVKKVRIESDSDFKINFKDLYNLIDGFNLPRGMLPMFYKIAGCFDLVSKDVHYDKFVRMRPDQVLNITKFDMDEIFNSELALLHHPAYKNGRFASDQFAFGSYETMQVYSNVWENINRYLTTDILSSNAGTLNPEALVYEHLEYNDISWTKIVHSPYPEFVVGKVCPVLFYDALLNLLSEGFNNELLVDTIDIAIYINLISESKIISIERLNNEKARFSANLKLVFAYLDSNDDVEKECLSNVIASFRLGDRKITHLLKNRLANLS